MEGKLGAMIGTRLVHASLESMERGVLTDSNYISLEKSFFSVVGVGTCYDVPAACILMTMITSLHFHVLFLKSSNMLAESGSGFLCD